MRNLDARRRDVSLSFLHRHQPHLSPIASLSARGVHFWAVSAFVACSLLACDKGGTGDKGGKENAPSGPSAAAAAPPPTSTAAPLPALAPADIDVAALRKKLGCTDARRALCRVLGEFADAGRFAPRIPSGEGRFIGTAYTLEKGAEKSELLLLSAIQAPTSTVPAGELALRIGMGPVPDDKRDHGVKLASALARGDTVPRTNQTAPYVKTWKPADARGTMQTSGNSVRLVTEESFLRQTSTKTLLVRVRMAPSGTEDVTAAELWAVTW